MKTGLVLEGGAMRGMYTAGVLDVLMENDIKVDGTIGVSAGACFGCNYKSRQIGRSIRYNLKYCKDPRYVSIRSLLFSGDIYNAKFCYEEIPVHLDPFDVDTYQKNSTEFYVVATDVNTGKAITGKKLTEDTFFAINMEAAKEIAVQIRLRNLSGIILVDFINLNDPVKEEALKEELRRLFKQDSVQTEVVDITKLGLMEITRKKVYKTLSEQLDDAR